MSSTKRCLVALALLLSWPAMATTVYKSTDDNGTVTFSDTIPADNAPVETLQIPVSEPSGNEYAQSLEDMRETTDRMAADRREREKHRAEMRKLQAETAAKRRSNEYANYYDPYYSGYRYTGGYYGYPIRRRHHHRPEHPIVKPPLLPPGGLGSPAGTFPRPHIRPLFTPRTRGTPRQ